MANKDKGPRSLFPPSDAKKPRSELHEDWREMRPAWRVSLLEMVDPFGWHKLTIEQAAQVRGKLAGFESMRWKEILYNSGYRNHIIATARLCIEARLRLEAIEQDDTDSLVSLGITQKGRIYGILEHNVLKVLWWDPEHVVCPVEKPNT